MFSFFCAVLSVMFSLRFRFVLRYVLRVLIRDILNTHTTYTTHATMNAPTLPELWTRRTTLGEPPREVLHHEWPTVRVLVGLRKKRTAGLLLAPRCYETTRAAACLLLRVGNKRVAAGGK